MKFRVGVIEEGPRAGNYCAWQVIDTDTGETTIEPIEGYVPEEWDEDEDEHETCPHCGQEIP